MRASHLLRAPLGVVHSDEVVGEAELRLELAEEVDAQAGAALSRVAGEICYSANSLSVCRWSL